MNKQTLTAARRMLLIGTVCMAACTIAPGAEFFLRTGVITNQLPDGGGPVVMWGFAKDSAFGALDGTNTVPGPTLVIPPGDTSLVIHLDNDLGVPVSLVIPGRVSAAGPTPTRSIVDGRALSFTHEAAPSNSVPEDYVWNNIPPGTLMYFSGSHPAVHVQMGLYGAIKKDAGSNMAYPGVPYDSEVFLLFSEIDPALHNAIATDNYGTNKAMQSTVNYQPKYFLINGTAYTNGLPTIQAGQPNGRILLRLLNAGLANRVPVINNAFVQQVAEDGNKSPYPRQICSALLCSLKTMDAVLRVPETNIFAVYDRRLGLVNSTNGLGGMLTFLEVSGDPLTNGNEVTGVAIALSNDHQRTILSWVSDTPASVLACTNRYYSTNPADWFMLASNVAPPWAHDTAASTPACYYRIVNGGFTSEYDVGKFTVNIRQSDGASPSENWIASPLELIDNLGNTVLSKSFDEMMLDMCVSDATVVGNRDTVNSQDGIGGPSIYARRANGVWANVVGGPRATNFYATQGYDLTINTAHPGPDKPMTFVGRVPTNNILVGTILKSDGAAPRENWVAYPYPAGTVTFDAAGLAAVVVDEPIVGNRDYVYSQEGVGGATLNARRGSGVWANVVGGTTATNLFGGQQYIITITPAHSGMATNWLVPKPY